MKKLHEKAITSTQAKKAGLALAYVTDGKYRTYVLYNAQQVMDDIDIDVDDVFEKVMCFYRATFAMMVVKDVSQGQAWGASEVKQSAAVKGYGPLLYDIVMAKEHGLIPDRHEVSVDAQKIWNYYFNNRKDVTHKKLDDVDNPKTPTKVDDAQVHAYDDGDGEYNDEFPVNYAYFEKRSPNVANLVRNNEKVMGFLQLDDVEYVINASSSKFFNSKYKG